MDAAEEQSRAALEVKIEFGWADQEHLKDTRCSEPPPDRVVVVCSGDLALFRGEGKSEKGFGCLRKEKLKEDSLSYRAETGQGRMKRRNSTADKLRQRQEK